MRKIIDIIRKTIINILRKAKHDLRALGHHICTFWYPWLILGVMLGLSLSSRMTIPYKTHVLTILAFAFLIVLFFKPMNIIYGLIGTHGYIGIFFLLFFFINYIFAEIYYHTCFEKAGITYDINQPHVEFNLFDSYDGLERIVLCSDTLERLPETSKDSIHYYYRIDFSWVMRNTLLTSLMQEPTDFFAVSSTYTGVRYNKEESSGSWWTKLKLWLDPKHKVDEDPNYEMAKFFQWFSTFHILISWILLGVFISLVYQKFRKS